MPADPFVPCGAVVWSLALSTSTTKQCKYRCFFAPRKPKNTKFTMQFASGSKNHGIYSVFVPVPSKNTGIYAVFTMLQDVVNDKHTVFYDVVVLAAPKQHATEVRMCPAASSR